MTYAQLIKHFGAVRAAAKAAGVSHQAVYRWKRNNRIPMLSQLAIAKATKDKLKASK